MKNIRRKVCIDVLIKISNNLWSKVEIKTYFQVRNKLHFVRLPIK